MEKSHTIQMPETPTYGMLRGKEQDTPTTLYFLPFFVLISLSPFLSSSLSFFSLSTAEVLLKYY